MKAANFCYNLVKPGSAGRPLLFGGSPATWSLLLFHSLKHGLIHTVLHKLLKAGWRMAMKALKTFKPQFRSAREILGEVILFTTISAVTT